MVNFAAETTNTLAQLSATSSRLSAQLTAMDSAPVLRPAVLVAKPMDTVGVSGTTKQDLLKQLRLMLATPSDRPPGTAVSLDFVNELVDTLFVQDAAAASDGPATHAAGMPQHATVVTPCTVLDPTSVLPASPSTSSSTVFGIGSTVWIHGLAARPELNSCMGTIVEALADDGRYGVRVEGSSLFGRPSVDVRIRGANVRGTLFEGT